MIIAKNFAPKLQYFKIFCNNDDCCNEPLKKFWYNESYNKSYFENPELNMVSKIKIEKSEILEDFEIKIADVELEHSRQENLIGFISFASCILLVIGCLCSAFKQCLIRARKKRKPGLVWKIPDDLS